MFSRQQGRISWSYCPICDRHYGRMDAPAPDVCPSCARNLEEIDKAERAEAQRATDSVAFRLLAEALKDADL